MKKEKSATEVQKNEPFEFEELDDAALAAAAGGIGKEPPTINNGCNFVAGCGAAN